MKRSALFLAAGFIAGAVLAANVVGAGDSNPSFYTVTQGDSWQSIATAHGVSTVALQRFNCPGNQTTTLPSSCTGTPRVGRGLMIPEAVTPPTSTTPATSTVAPTTTTIAPPTTTVPASTTTLDPTTTQAPTTTVAPSTTAPSPTTTSPPAGAFSEDFATGADLCGVRFDCGWSGEWNAGSAWGDNANDWQADHVINANGTCGDPNTTSHPIHLTGSAQASRAFYYFCVPASNPDGGHMMTSVNTEGYVSAWFSPKQVFRNVQRVCWDQNLTDVGGGKWTAVNFLIPSEYQGETDLGYTTRDFPPGPNAPSSPQGDASFGVSTYPHGNLHLYNNHQFRGGGVSAGQVADKAARYQHCVIDNGNGTVTMTIARPGGGVASTTVSGEIPNGDIRVTFVDDNYNDDKHFWNPERFVPRDSSGLYTIHWDNIQIS